MHEPSNQEPLGDEVRNVVPKDVLPIAETMTEPARTEIQEPTGRVGHVSSSPTPPPILAPGSRSSLPSSSPLPCGFNRSILLARQGASRWYVPIDTYDLYPNLESPSSVPVTRAPPFSAFCLW